MASVLLGEANPNLSRLFATLLERLGHEVIVMGGGSAVPPPADLLLLEPACPHFLDQARMAREHNRELPIVYMSKPPPDARFVTLGPNAYLTKPFTIDGLDTAIRAALAAARAGGSAPRTRG